jgi:protein-S-isoprenylcysteine O-methyltransferase Ste14
MKYLLKLIDSGIYFLFGPFSVLFLFPRMCREIDQHFYVPPFNYIFDKTGVVFMWMGATLAIWCSLIMFMNKFGSVVPFYKPKKLVASGPFAIVRHPMMWSLFLVLIGEAITFSSAFTVLWLIIWARFSHIYICKYEEPFLFRHFGEEYQKYAQKVPRWIPGTKPQPISI